MKLYKTKQGIVLGRNTSFYLLENEDWDTFVNDDNLRSKMLEFIRSGKPNPDALHFIEDDLEAPIQTQEIWASGVTYINSKLAREAESKDAGGDGFYARVYQAERPELFFKATAWRTVRPGGKVKIRKDSSWDVPEPELTLMVTSSGKIVGYTIGNDMSSRSIEGENPLYLPQAKTYDGCASVGPCIYVPEKPLPGNTLIYMEINRARVKIFDGSVKLNQMKRNTDDLAAWLFRECSFPHGCLLMTGTGIIPADDFTLHTGDEIRITIKPIGTLVNRVG